MGRKKHAGHRGHAPQKRKVLKIKRDIPKVAVALPPEVPEPHRAIIEAINAGHVEEIHFSDTVDPTLWERIKKWWAGDDDPPEPESKAP